MTPGSMTSPWLRVGLAGRGTGSGMTSAVGTSAGSNGARSGVCAERPVGKKIPNRCEYHQKNGEIEKKVSSKTSWRIVRKCVWQNFQHTDENLGSGKFECAWGNVFRTECVGPEIFSSLHLFRTAGAWRLQLFQTQCFGHLPVVAVQRIASGHHAVSRSGRAVAECSADPASIHRTSCE